MKALLPSLLVVLLVIASAEAQIPRTISYQGFLCDTTGQPKPDATYALTFRLYNAVSGGTAIWSEQKNLTTMRGLFSTRLGDLIPFGPGVTFENQYWLGIQVGTEAELSPRLPLSAIGNSFRAAKSDTASFAGFASRASKADTALYAAASGSGGGGPWQTSGSNIYYNNGSVGIGISTPSSNLHVAGLNGVLFEGTEGSGTIPKEGEGVRLMWYPKKAAFRAGSADTISWEDTNIGWYSTALGYQTVARGSSSTALGYQTVARGDYSAAMGKNAEAIGYYSTAAGLYTKALGDYSTAMGAYTEASGQGSTAMGNSTRASGSNSTAMGRRVSTGGYDGSFIIGDNSSDVYSTSSKSNEFMAVFDGGYTLWTDRSGQNGVYMNGHTSGWTNISDRNKKENFRMVDGEELLSKIRSMSITEWNYKGGDPSIKYIGPVAQDFYAAFHLGGTDSLGINSICIDGVNMAAIQALEKRTAELEVVKTELARAMTKLERATTELAEMRTGLSQLEAALMMHKDLAERER